MALIRPFAAVRPKPELAARICELPYDVVSTAEARALAQGNPLSFFHVSRPEIDLPDGTDPHAPEVYKQGASAFESFFSQGAIFQDAQPCYYLYRQTMGTHVQTGIVVAAGCEDYLKGIIRKHELTRPDKEDDRVRHIEALNAQTGPAFLLYPSNDRMRELLAGPLLTPPVVDFTAKDGIRHAAWVISDRSLVTQIEQVFAAMPRLYIADGHHRSAAAGRIFQSRQGRGDSSGFLAVVFPHDEAQILPYHRVIKDLSGLSAAELLARLRRIFQVETVASVPATAKHTLGFYVAGNWHRLTFRPESALGPTPADTLDVALLQAHVLGPILGIDNPRTSPRINFVGGIRGAAELEKLVNQGEYACAFYLAPTRVEDLIAIADAGGIMPPKSTWFEPKLRDGLFSHRI
jgi:uncharacterized protein (DUF1015 family)